MNIEIITLYVYFEVFDYKVKYYSFNPSPVRSSGTVSLRGRETAKP